MVYRYLHTKFDISSWYGWNTLLPFTVMALRHAPGNCSSPQAAHKARWKLNLTQCKADYVCRTWIEGSTRQWQSPPNIYRKFWPTSDKCQKCQARPSPDQDSPDRRTGLNIACSLACFCCFCSLQSGCHRFGYDLSTVYQQCLSLTVAPSLNPSLSMPLGCWSGLAFCFSQVVRHFPAIFTF